MACWPRTSGTTPEIGPSVDASIDSDNPSAAWRRARGREAADDCEAEIAQQPRALQRLAAAWRPPDLDPAFAARLIDVCPPLGAPETLDDAAMTALPGLFSTLLGGSSAAARPVALAWAALRDAAIVFDDVEDLARDCRELAVRLDLNAANGLLFTAGRILNSLEAWGIDAAAATDVRQTFMATGLAVAAGQQRDLTATRTTLADSWAIVRAKTGVAGGLACWAGARLQSAEPAVLDACRAFGEHLGCLEQLRDDFRDVWGASADDLAHNRTHSLALAYALEVLPSAEADQLRAQLRAAAAGDAGARQAARQVVAASGAGLYLVAQSAVHAAACRAQLETLDAVGAIDESASAQNARVRLEQTWHYIQLAPPAMQSGN